VFTPPPTPRLLTTCAKKEKKNVRTEDRLCGLVVRVAGYRTEMYCASCEVRTEFIYVMWKKVDRHCGLVVRVPGYRTELRCTSCEVRTEFIYVTSGTRPRVAVALSGD
jgi:hypothetical protein